MKKFRYHSGQEIRVGDHISYHHESGKVEFVVTEKTANQKWIGTPNNTPGAAL
jgi:hypothetical protein